MEQQHDTHRETTALAKGAGIFFAGTLAGSSLRYAYQLIAARSLGPGAYGGLLLGIAALQVMQLIADLGLSQGVVRYTAIYQGAGDRPRVKGVILFALGAVLLSAPLLGALMFLVARPVAQGLFHNPNLALVLRFMAIALPFYALGTILAFCFQGLQIIKYRVYVSQFIEPGARVGLAVLFLALGGGLLGVLAAHLAGVLLGLAAALLLMRRACPEVFRRGIPAVYERKAILAFSWPMMGTFLMGHLVVWNDAFFLGVLRGAKEVGLYGAAQRTALLLTFVLGAFAAIFGPLVADLLNREKKQDLARHFKAVVHWSFSLTLPLAALAVLFARPLLRLFGEPFVAAAGPLAVLAAGWTVHALVGLCGTVISMSGRSKLQLLNNVFLLASNIGLLILLVPSHGMLGAAVATASSIVLYDIMAWLEVRHILGLNPFRRDVLKPLVSGGLAAAILALLGFLRRGGPGGLLIAAGSALFLFVYGAAILGLGIRDEDKTVLGKILSKLKLWDGAGSEWGS